MELSDELIQKFKDLTEKKQGEKISWEEAKEGVSSFLRLMELFYKQATIDHKRQLKLKEHPKGFHIEGQGYTCAICYGSISDEETWYDKWGIKCLLCQKAIDKKIIPGSVAKNDNTWYSEHDLHTRFNIDKRAMKEFVKAGVLKPRIVPNASGRPHVYIFMIKDNKDTLPPKHLTESEHVSYKGEEKGRIHIEPWYRFVDPYKHLEVYKIMNYLNVVNKNETHIK